ncbi:hypothetical protein [Leeuwenhoekiella marinoflava]|uniref:Uncharacterized protein n=2 Tax=Leeuwenhoekiella marinoflava TaxID=988 RepID=A0A4V1KSK3_9FLAO|nr:hypothetical protein [Leeuwenhoekiella marinoflava]RXG32038.1 hypothetical protein DSL99_1343 [Leeuwenhoekiella marinoflava]SHE95817.1 hypothetical protein SAMN02745246_01398 [Leeuwenhoekiella marinoflava DSM 3653]
MKKAALLLLRLCVLALLLTAVVCATESCSSKKKATERYRNTTEFDKSESSSAKIENDKAKDCTAVSKTETDWSAINENIQFELIDPDQEGYANLSPDGKGGFNFTGKNVKASSGKSQEQKKETRNDSVAKKETDNSSEELETSSTESGQTLDSGRTSNSEATRWPFWFLLVPVVLGALIYFRGWKFWK